MSNIIIDPEVIIDPKIIDPNAWTDSERIKVTEFSASLSNVQADLDTNVASFQVQASELIASEEQFAKDLEALDLAIDESAIDKTILEIKSTSSNVDAIFSKLNGLILGNNDAASKVLSAIAMAGDNIQFLTDAQSKLNANVSSYTSAISSFRTFAHHSSDAGSK